MILHQIENEYAETVHSPQDTRVIHMQQLESAFRDAGIVVPFTHNEAGMRSQSWSTDYENVGGAVNLYGLDSYPGGLSCRFCRVAARLRPQQSRVFSLSMLTLLSRYQP